jgi:antitoxin MazE
MKSQVQKWGNSLALRIPKAFAAEVGLDQNSPVDVSVEDGAIIVRSIRRRQYSLSGLLTEINDSNVHSETDWGGPVGGEVW